MVPGTRPRTIAAMLATLAALAMALVFGSVSAHASPAPATQRLAFTYTIGGINLNAYCRSVMNNESAYAARGSTQSGWVCVSGSAQQEALITNACRFQYPELVARGIGVFEGDGNGVTDRKCTAVVNARLELGGMNLNVYCQAVGQGTSYNSGGNVDGWYCNRNTGSTSDDARIDLSAACRVSYPGRVQEGYAVVHAYPNYTAAFRIGCVALA